MGFKAAEAVSKLEWDFRPYVDAFGVSPEPTGQSLWLFQQNYNNVISAARRTAVSRAAVLAEEFETSTAEERRAEAEKWAGLSWDEAIAESARILEGALGTDMSEQVHSRLATLVDELTGSCPSSDQIMALPGRTRSAYLGWFVGQVSDPEGLTVGMS